MIFSGKRARTSRINSRSVGQLKLNMLVIASAGASGSIRSMISLSVSPRRRSRPDEMVCVGASAIASITTQSWPAWRSAAAMYARPSGWEGREY